MLWSDELQTEQIQAAGLVSWKSTRGRGDISIYNGSGLIMISSLHRIFIVMFVRDLILCLVHFVCKNYCLFLFGK